MSTVTPTDRIAAAPISWGVCEVPGWGYQMAPERVLSEMREVGFVATELGPEGFLPDDPESLTQVLRRHELQAVGGFVPLLLHVDDHDPVAEVEGLLDTYDAVGAGVMVLSAVTGLEGYDTRPELDEDGWSILLRNLDRLRALAAERGLHAVLHPHVGTMVEQGPEVLRVLDGSEISLCLDTGHLLIGGVDPTDLTRQAADRIAHTHMKDVDAAMARRVQDGELSYTEAVRDGMYRPLGEGDVDVAAIVGHLRDHGYDGWYTLEQDTILPGEPHDEGPLPDVRTSVEHLRQALAAE